MPTYKDKKKGTWFVSFRYTDWTGKRRQTCKRGFKTQREAKEYESAFLNRLSHSSDITFSNMADLYLEDMEVRLKPTTLATKRYIIEQKLKPYFGSFKLYDIDTITVLNWQRELLNYRNEKGEPFAPTYLKTIQEQLSCLFNYAIKHYGMSKNPCRIAGSIGKQKAGERPIWTREQYDIFSKAEKKPAMKLAFDILFYTGIRCGELLALTGEDVLPDHSLDINKNYQVVDGVEMFLVPKTERSKRKVSIPDFLYDEIQQYISALYEFQPEDRIFYFTKSALSVEIRRVADRVGLPRITVHDLRHSHASLLISMGVDIKAISERLGHESVKITWDTYAHLYPNKDRELADQLQSLKGSGRNALDSESTDSVKG